MDVVPLSAWPRLQAGCVLWESNSNLQRGRDMKLQSLMLRNSLFLLTLILALPAFRAAAQTRPDAARAQEKQSKSQSGLKPMPHDEDGREAVEEGPEFLTRRQDWFFKPRAFPQGFIPQGARQRALYRMHQMLQNEGRLNASIAPGMGFAAPGPTTSGWQFIGPRATSNAFWSPFTSGRVTALAVNPNNSNNVYLGGADGGLWVTTDAGTTWNPLTDFPPSAGIASVAVGSLVVDPSTCTSGATGICSTVYVGTGEDNFASDNIYGEGVLKCTVAAGTPPTASCTQDNTFRTPSPLTQTRGGPLVGALAINPKTSGSTAILLAGVRGSGAALPSGIYCSADAGLTWKAVFGISGIVGTDAVFANDGTAFVALGFFAGDPNGNNGIYKSNVPVSSCTAVTDLANTTPGGTGSKWIKQSLPAGTPSASLGRIALAILPSASSTGSNATVYTAIADSTGLSSNLLGVVKTTNGGTSAWTQLSGTPSFCNSQCFFDLVIAVDPADITGKTVFAGGAASVDTLIRSTDGGNTWTEVSGVNSGTGLHVDTHALAFSGNGGLLYVGNDGGVWSSAANLTSGTTTWNNLNANLGITQFYPGISIHTSTPLSGLGGAQDNDLQQYQGPSLVWQSQNIGCDGTFTAIDPGIPSTIYGECEYVPGQVQFPIIVVSFTGQQLGNGFFANFGINNTDRGSFIPPLVMDLKNPQTLYFGTCRVWQTKDGAKTWTAISPDVTAATHPAGCGGAGATLSTIAPALSNSNTVYTGSDGGEIEVTTDGGTTWTSIATSALPTRSITQIAVDPSDNKIAYVTFSGFSTCAVGCAGATGHVFKTVNGTLGAATVWTDIDGAGLPDIPVNAIVIDPDDLTHNTLYVGTDIGAFFTTTGGATWSVLGATNSLPPTEILGLALHNPSRTLRAATHGRGMWDLNLGGQAAFGITSIAPFSTNAPGTAFPLTVNGNGFVSASTPTVYWNGSPKATTFVSGTQLTASILATDVASGAADQVTVRQGTSTSNSLVYTVLNPIPGITSISPTTATAGSSGQTLTVNGSNFLTGATLVQFNTIPLPANAVTVTNSSTLTVQVPAANLATAQTVSVDTFNPQPGGGPDPNPNPPILTITAAAAPTITSLNPTSGAVGTSVTIAGTNFGATPGTSTVTFNGTTATPASSNWSATSIAVPVPAGATTGNVMVTVGGVPSNGVAFTVTSSGSFTVSGAATTATAGGSGMSTITVTPTGGFLGNVNVTCPAAGLPAGVTCSPNPLPINVTGTAAVTGQLTLTVAPPSTTLTASAASAERLLYAAGTIPTSGGKGWWTLSASTGLTAMFLLVLPARKRYRAALGLGLVCVLSFTLGCSGYSGGGGGGLATTTTKISVPASPGTKAPQGTTINFSITVTSSGTTANGQVQLFDGTTTLGTPVTVSNGTATIMNSGLLPGTHSISAHYLGDTYTQASQSGMLNVTSTGTTTFAIMATPAASNGSPTVNITIN